MRFNLLNNKNFYLNKEILFFTALYLSLLIGFFLNENSTGGALSDYYTNKSIISKFAHKFKDTFFNYESLSTRHSPVLNIFLSIFKKLAFSDLWIRLIHLHLCLALPYLFFKILKLKFKTVDNKILFLLTGLIFLSPTFRSLSIWPDSRILGLTFFTLSILFFLKFKENFNSKYVVLNIITYAFSAYISPNFSVFSIFYLIFYFKIFGLYSKKSVWILLLNFILAYPAFHYVIILDINFLKKTAAININEEEKIFFHNIFNDLLITFSIILFYLIPFFIIKIVKLKKIFSKFNFLISIILFFLCIYFFDYNYERSGGGIFFKFSNFIYNNNFLFFIISLVSILIIIPSLIESKSNLLLFFLIIINNPQYTIYHKYFDPFLIILFFSLFNFQISLKHKKRKDFLFIYIYFFIFLIISNLKLTWTT